MVSVTILGVHGCLGKPTIEGLLSEPFVSKISTPIKVISTDPSKKVVDSTKLQYISSKEVPYKEALAGSDVIINLTNPFIAPTAEITEAVKEAKPKLYIPSQFGTDLVAASDVLPYFLNAKTSFSTQVREAGIKVLDFYNGFFIDDQQLFLGVDLSVLNFNKETNEVDIIGDENTLINPVFLNDIGKALGAIVTSDLAKVPDVVRIYSDRVTLGDLVAHYNRKHGVTLKVNKVPAADVLAKVQEAYNKNFTFADFGLYLQGFIAAGEGKGVIFENDNDRELINPGESLFKWTKYVI